MIKISITGKSENIPVHNSVKIRYSDCPSPDCFLSIDAAEINSIMLGWVPSFFCNIYAYMYI